MSTSATVKTCRRKDTASAKKGGQRRKAPLLAEPPPSQPPADGEDLRRRWQRARTVISQALEAENEHDPRIWERGAYQLWLWLVVELLVVRRDDIDVKDLLAISRMLHDQRKLSLAEMKRLGPTADHDGTALHSTKLPEHFGDLVRQIYGTNFQDDCAPPQPAGCGPTPAD